ncbi:MAG: insulinase family protein [Verrucomicrobiota bacterium]|nr:insulinase family protein [Verrucomicrobiota bacterium]
MLWALAFIFATNIEISMAAPSLHEAPIAAYEEVTDESGLVLRNPDLKERKIAKIRLPNGLEAMLISDPGADQSSAAVSVGAGSWNDPEEYPGMAHFCEHMLFLGTGKYPDSNEFFNNLSNYSGVSNAFTAPDRTVYMFSCKQEGFLENLDRFSRFFIDPLFNASNISRELHAIDQEYAKNLENDRWREYMVFKELGNPRHPNRKFSTGNSKTLGGIPSQALQQWHSKHYAASEMHLFVYSGLPMETLKAQAAAMFTDVPQRKTESAPAYQPITSPEQKGHIVYIKPIQQRQTLSLTWELPPELSDDASRSADLVAYAISRGQKYSLQERLKSELLVDGVWASVDDLGGKENRLFSITLELSPKGIEQIDTVVLRCFETIAGLQKSGVPVTLFQEKNTVSLLSYEYQTRQDAFKMASSIGESISEEPLSTFPRKQVIATHYSKENIAHTLAELTPDQCIFSLTADPRLTGVEPDRTEKWFEAEYAVRPLPKEWTTLWKNAKPNPSIRLATANPFVPTRFEKAPLQPDAARPVLLSNNDAGIAYYTRAPEFAAPEAAFHLHISSPEIQPSAKSTVLLSLYLDHLTDLLNPTLLAAQSAGLATRFELDHLKLHILVSGFNDKAPLLLQEILRQMPLQPPTKEQFDLYAARHAKAFANSAKDLSYTQAKELADSLLMNDRPTDAEKLAALQLITHEDFLHFHRKLFERTYTEALFAGNLTLGEAQSCWVDVQHTLSKGIYPPSEHATSKVLQLPDTGGPFSLTRTTDVQGNATLLAIDEGPFSFEKRSTQDILSSVLQEAFFNELRTKQKTGYITKANPTEIEERLFHFFIVQSNSHEPEDLLYRFELFLEEFLQTLDETIPETRFDTLKASAIHSLKTRYRNLRDKAALWDLLAFEKGANFHYIDQRIAALQLLTYDRFLSLSNDLLSRSNHKRLAILYQGRLNAPFAYSPTDTPNLLKVSHYVAKQEVDQ